MGWQISLQTNDVHITDECAKDLWEATGKENPWWDEEEVTDGENRLFFNCDHMEHMDYMWNKAIQAVLLKHKVNGDICFSSADGDNSGDNWGYRFKDGVMTRLRGVVTYVEVSQ